MEKLIAIVGPTATGKSELGVELAKRCDGEIVSADSRQVFRGLDVGTGKVPRDKFFGKALIPDVLRKTYFHAGIPHHLIDVVDVGEQFGVAEYKKLADKAIDGIRKRNKVPIVVGGSGQYVDAVVYNIVPPPVPPNPTLRDELAEEPTETLMQKLITLDPRRAETVEPENKRRIIRAIEIATTLGEVPPLPEQSLPSGTLMLGLLLDDQDIKNAIAARTRERLQSGWVVEVYDLLQHGVKWATMEELGLGYRSIALYLQKKIPEHRLEESIINAEYQYAKRQVRWFERNKDIQWFEPTQREQILQRVDEFLKKS